MKKLFLLLLFVAFGMNAQYNPTTGVNYVKFAKVPPNATANDSILTYSADGYIKKVPKSVLLAGASGGSLQDACDIDYNTTTPIIAQGIRITNVGNNPVIESALLIGQNAGDDLVGTGSQALLAIGTNAGLGSSGGNYQTYVGMGAGNAANGDSATFFGFAAGNEQIGNQVVSIGSGAGVQSNGDNCTFIGQGAGNSNLSNNVTAIGTNAAIGNGYTKTIHLSAQNSLSEFTEATAENQFIINTNDNNVRFNMDVATDLDFDWPETSGRLALQSEVGTNAIGDGIAITEGVIDVSDLSADTITTGSLQSSGDIESTGADVKALSGTVAGAYLTSTNDITAGGNIQAFTITTDDNVTIGNSAIIAGDLNLTNQLPSRIAIIDASRNVISANTTTYPDLSELAFLKGATSNIQTQFNTLASNYFPIVGGSLTGTGGNGFIGLIPQSTSPSTPASGVKLYARTTGALSWKGTNGFERSFVGTGLTADRTYTLPDANVTLAGLDNSQIFTNKDLSSNTNIFPTLNQNTTGSAAKWTTARTLAGNSVDGSANVNFANKFIVQGTSDSGLSAAQFMGSLGTGLIKNTTTTGVFSIAVAGTDYGDATLAGTQTFTGTKTFSANLSASGGITVANNDITSRYFGISTPFNAGYNSALQVFGTAPVVTVGAKMAASIELIWAPTSGLATYTSYNAAPTLNLTGGASGAVRGFYSNPTITSLGSASLRSFEWSNTSGQGYGFYGAGSAPSYMSGNLGLGQTTATAYLHIKAGTATASTAPIKLTSGTNLTTPENGAIEYDGSHFYGTAGGVRYQLDQELTVAGSYSGVGTATTTFTVSIGQTLANTTYKVNATPTSALSAALFYITNKTTTSFDVMYLTGLTGTVTFDWTIVR